MTMNFSSARRFLPFLAGGIVVALALLNRPATSAPLAAVPRSLPALGRTVTARGIVVGHSYYNDTSPPLRTMPQIPIGQATNMGAPENPKLPSPNKGGLDTVIQRFYSPNLMPGTLLNFDGIAYPGVNCNCHPPDTNGEAGATQYVQMVNQGYKVFNKANGAGLLGPSSIASLWSGFGGACQTDSHGDPVVLYDQFAQRWVLTNFAGADYTDECIAVSVTSDATGSYYRYGFHLGNQFYDYPHLGVWPDGYYMSDNVLDVANQLYLGPQPFTFDRAQMLVGQAAFFQTTNGPLGGSVGRMLPADIDGGILPPVGAAAPYLAGGATTAWPLYKFHVDWDTPANSTFLLNTTLAATAYNTLCPSTRACIPQGGTATRLDALGDRLMYRLAYRRFGDGHEALVGNQTVDAGGGVAGIRWFEINNVTSGTPGFVQQSTYAPDSTSRWMGSVAMDRLGNLALGFSASDAVILPQIRYAGRLAGDPANTLAQGEAHLLDGNGAQTSVNSANRWGDYSDMTVDPGDDCTFWYTTEYYAATAANDPWRTRIGSFKFAGCTAPTPTVTPTGTLPTGTATVTPQPPTHTPTVTATATATGTPDVCLNYVVTTATATLEAGTTLLSGSQADNAAVPLVFPFPVQFYGTTYNTANVSTNGNLQFSSNNPLALNSALPVAGFNNAIMPFWDDLDLSTSAAAGNGIYTALTGTAPNRVFDVEWRGCIFSSGICALGTVDFELRFYENQSRIDVVYGALSGTDGTGASATIGTQRGTGSQFTQYSFNTSGVVAPGTLLRFVIPGCGPSPTLTPTTTSTGVPPPPTGTATVPATASRTVTATGTLSPPSTATATAAASRTVTATGTINPPNTATATATPSRTPTTTGTVTPASTATATTTLCATRFSDVTDPAAYYYQPVYYLACRGVIGGYSDGTFRPFVNTTRGQMSKIVVLAYNLPIQTPATGYTFSDAPATSTFFPYIETAVSHNLIGGYACGGVNGQTGATEPCDSGSRPYYRPGNFVTRGQLTKIVVGAAQQIQGWPLLDPPAATFSDVPVGSTFFRYVETAVCHQVLGGYSDGTFRPSNNAFRGQIAKIVYNAVTDTTGGCGP